MHGCVRCAREKLNQVLQKHDQVVAGKGKRHGNHAGDPRGDNKNSSDDSDQPGQRDNKQVAYKTNQGYFVEIVRNQRKHGDLGGS